MNPEGGFCMHKYVFLKVDLLLQENSFEALRNFLSSAAAADVPNFCSLELSDEGLIVPTEHHALYGQAMGNLIGQQLIRGYILTQMRTLCRLVNK